MEAKSHDLRDEAFKMKNNAKSLEQEARKRNCRLMCIIIVIVLALLINIIVPIVVKKH